MRWTARGSGGFRSLWRSDEWLATIRLPVSGSTEGRGGTGQVIQEPISSQMIVAWMPSAVHMGLRVSCRHSDAAQPHEHGARDAAAGGVSPRNQSRCIRTRAVRRPRLARLPARSQPRLEREPSWQLSRQRSGCELLPVTQARTHSPPDRHEPDDARGRQIPWNKQSSALTMTSACS